MADLHIPDESWAAWCQGADVDRDVAIADIRLIAAPVVAAELRRLALLTQPLEPFNGDLHGSSADACRWRDARRLETRAEQLDPGGSWPSFRSGADELDPPQSGGAPA